MKQLFTAASVEEAKELAAREFGVSEEKISFNVIEEPKKGLFGKIKGEAKVEAEYTRTKVDIAVDYVKSVMQAMEIGRAGGDHVIHLIIGIATAALGILIFTNPFGTLTLTLRVIGIVLVADALTNIFTTRTYYTQI